LQLIQQRERHPAVARRERSTPTPEHRRASPGSLAPPTPHRIVSELSEASYITRHRTGRRSTYVVHPDLPPPDAVARNQNVGELLSILVSPT
jgi:hypothetical protein